MKRQVTDTHGQLDDGTWGIQSGPVKIGRVFVVRQGDVATELWELDFPLVNLTPTNGITITQEFSNTPDILSRKNKLLSKKVKERVQHWCMATDELLPTPPLQEVPNVPGFLQTVYQENQLVGHAFHQPNVEGKYNTHHFMLQAHNRSGTHSYGPTISTGTLKKRATDDGWYDVSLRYYLTSFDWQVYKAAD